MTSYKTHITFYISKSLFCRRYLWTVPNHIAFLGFWEKLKQYQCYNCTIKCWIVQDSPIDSIAANIAMQKCAASTQEAEDDLTVPAGHGITDLVSQTRDLGDPGC